MTLPNAYCLLLVNVYLSFWFLTSNEGNGGTVNFQDVKMLKKNSTVFFVDVRNRSEIQKTGRIPGSVNIPLHDLEEVLMDTTGKEFLAKYDRRKPTVYTPIVFTCKSGKRARAAQKIAWKLGFKDVKMYPGGWDEWSALTRKNNNATFTFA